MITWSGKKYQIELSGSFLGEDLISVRVETLPDTSPRPHEGRWLRYNLDADYLAEILWAHHLRGPDVTRKEENDDKSTEG